jgi:hypothetical protein
MITPATVRIIASFIEERIHDALSKSEKLPFVFWFCSGIVVH